MTVVCPKCSTSYRIDDGTLRLAKISELACEKCGHSIPLPSDSEQDGSAKPVGRESPDGATMAMDVRELKIHLAKARRDAAQEPSEATTEPAQAASVPRERADSPGSGAAPEAEAVPPSEEPEASKLESKHMDFGDATVQDVLPPFHQEPSPPEPVAETGAAPGFGPAATEGSAVVASIDAPAEPPPLSQEAAEDYFRRARRMVLGAIAVFSTLVIVLIVLFAGGVIQFAGTSSDAPAASPPVDAAKPSKPVTPPEVTPPSPAGAVVPTAGKATPTGTARTQEESSTVNNRKAESPGDSAVQPVGSAEAKPSSREAPPRAGAAKGKSRRKDRAPAKGKRRRGAAASPTAEPEGAASKPAKGPAKKAAPEPAAPAKSPPAEAAGTGYLTLKTKPWTRVDIDGKEFGETPLFKVKLAAGRHSLHFVNEAAGIDVKRGVIIKADQNLKLDLELE